MWQNTVLALSLAPSVLCSASARFRRRDVVAHTQLVYPATRLPPLGGITDIILMKSFNRSKAQSTMLLLISVFPK